MLRFFFAFCFSYLRFHEKRLTLNNPYQVRVRTGRLIILVYIEVIRGVYFDNWSISNPYHDFQTFIQLLKTGWMSHKNKLTPDSVFPLSEVETQANKVYAYFAAKCIRFKRSFYIVWWQDTLMMCHIGSSTRNYAWMCHLQLKLESMGNAHQLI